MGRGFSSLTKWCILKVTIERTIVKPKEYLVSIGALKEIKRGRLSLEHIELCKKAVSEGLNIDGYSVDVKDKTSTAPTVTKSAVSNEKVIQELRPYRYTEDEFVAYTYENDKKTFRSLREADRHCGASMVVCYCTAPEIVRKDGRGHVRVYVERK